MQSLGIYEHRDHSFSCSKREDCSINNSNFGEQINFLVGFVKYTKGIQVSFWYSNTVSFLSSFQPALLLTLVVIFNSQCNFIYLGSFIFYTYLFILLLCWIILFTYDVLFIYLFIHSFVIYLFKHLQLILIQRQ